MNWSKLRHEILLPMLCCVEQGKFGDSAEFRIMPQGHEIDVQVCEDQISKDIQVTIADPKWANTTKGSQEHLQTSHLNKWGRVPVFGPFWQQDQKSPLESRAISKDERDTAYRDGLVEALDRKARVDGKGRILLVHARDYCGPIKSAEFVPLVEDAISRAKKFCFDELWIADLRKGFWFSTSSIATG